MDHDLSPPWTLLNIVKAIKAGLFAQPLPPCTTERKKADLMVTNGLTFQEQSWVPKAGEGTGPYTHCKSGQSRGNCHYQRAQVVLQPAFNCSYVYV